MPKTDLHIRATQRPGYKTVYYYYQNYIECVFIGFSWVNKAGQFIKSPTLERFVKKHNL